MAFNPMNNYNMFNNMNNMNNMNNFGFNNFNNFNNFVNMNLGMNMFNNSNPMVAQWNAFFNNFFNQMAKNNNIQNQNRFNIWRNNANNNIPSNRLPKLKQSEFADPFSQMPGPKTNVIFQTVKGYNVTIPAPLNIPMHQVLVQYMIKLGLGTGALYDGFYFLYNGSKIPIDDENILVGQIATTLHTHIIVLDTKDLIGSKL